ncbi:MAG TPA: hypothetical protein VF088_11465 [Pyrinomonadaceae bacterium]
MAKAFAEGKLPEPARLPHGNVDQQAAELAKAVSLRDDSSIAALYAAVLAAGFGVRDSDGSVMQTQHRGQGLILDASELAATAKLYGEGYGVMLSHLSEAFARGVPELKAVPLADVLLDGIRAGANSTNPSVRFLSRFIVELGRNGEPASDLLGNVDPTKTRLDSIQVSLILRRLTGDLAALQKPIARRASSFDRSPHSKEAVQNSHARSPFVRVSSENWQEPCPTGPVQDLVLDLNATISSVLFGKLADRLGGRLESYGKIAGIANLVAVVFKFILTYSLLDVEISMDGDMLQRTKSNTTPGELRTLTAKLKILPSSWDKFKCVRPLLNAAGLDLELPDSGPLHDTTVVWSLVLGGDSRGVLGSVIDYIKGDDESDNLVYLQAKAGSNLAPNEQTADKDGVSTIDVVGAPQKEDLTHRKVLEVNKAAGVTVSVQIKPTKIKDAETALSSLMDMAGIVVSFLTKDPVGGGVGLVFETMYRSNWYSADPFYFVVKDWEPCKGHWQGTMSYSTSFKEVGSAETVANKQSWNDQAQYDSEIVISGQRDNQGAPIARVKATASMVKERISTGKGVCYRTGTTVQQLQGSGTATTNGFSITMNPRSGEYHVSPPSIIVDAQGAYSVDTEVKGTCNNPFNKDLHQRTPQQGKLSPEGPVVEGIGKIDPNNPDEISGTNTVTIPTSRGGERKATIIWHLRRCQDQ